MDKKARDIYAELLKTWGENENGSNLFGLGAGDLVTDKKEAKIYKTYGLSPSKLNGHRLAMALADQYHPKFKRKAKRGAKPTLPKYIYEKHALLTIYIMLKNKKGIKRWASNISANKLEKEIGRKWTIESARTRYNSQIQKEEIFKLLEDKAISAIKIEKDSNKIEELKKIIEKVFSNTFSKSIVQYF